MEIQILLLIISLLTLGCQNEKENNLLFEQTIAETTHEWTTQRDTFTQSIIFKTGTIQLPLHIKWTTGIDQNDCNRVSNLSVKKEDTTTPYKVSHITIDKLPCSTEWDTTDSIQYETVIINGHLENINSKSDNSYNGTFAIINGVGDIITFKPEY